MATDLCVLAVPGYSYKRACYTHHLLTDPAQLDIIHSRHWQRPEATCVGLGPRQEAILRAIVAEPGRSMN
jgi:hypothetical protein